jgi:chromate transport protein ChrA
LDQDQETSTLFTIKDYAVLAFFFMLAVVLHNASAPVFFEMASLAAVVMAIDFIKPSKEENKKTFQLSLIGVAVFAMFSYVAMFKEPLAPFVIAFIAFAGIVVRDYKQGLESASEQELTQQ